MYYVFTSCFVFPGLALLKAVPTPLQSRASLTSYQHWLMWHTWMSPKPNAAEPPLFFDVLDAAKLDEIVDVMPCSSALHAVERHTVITLEAEEANQGSLGDRICWFARDCQSKICVNDVLKKWHLQHGCSDQIPDVAFSALAPISF